MLSIRTPVLTAIAAATVLALSSPATADYTEIDVTNGGTITGKVTYTGDQTSKTLEVDKNQEVCHTEKSDETYVTADDGGLAWVIVSIDNITEGKPMDSDPEPVLDNKECAFHPHVVTVTTGQKLIIKNDDPILHNTHAKLDGQTVFNYALPIPGQQLPKKIKKSGIMEVVCDAGHTWMHAWVGAFDQPYHTVTGMDGTFTLTDVPPGTYTLKFWHEKLGEQTKEVTVAAGETATVDVSW